jgi:hypothetical protein
VEKNLWHQYSCSTVFENPLMEAEKNPFTYRKNRGTMLTEVSLGEEKSLNCKKGWNNYEQNFEKTLSFFYFLGFDIFSFRLFAV